MFGTAQERLAHAETRVGLMLRGKYRIDRVIGVGGMASVYAATHRNGRKVAVKVLHTAASLNLDMRKRFLREGHAANAVNHPGAVVVIDDDVAEDGAAFLVMELLEGAVIEHLWQKHGERLPVEMVLAIGYELCGVLEAAHRAGIIHRDIKPENLFLTREGQLKVLDFGLAQLHDGQKLTAMGMVFGTPAFMAPEQASGRASHVDARSDLWAVGATMFTLFSGRTVHEASTVQDMLVAAATKPSRSLATVMPAADPRIVGLIDRAIALDKNERWPSSEAMRNAIGATSLALFGKAVPRLMPIAELEALRAQVSNQATVSGIPRLSSTSTDTDLGKRREPAIADLTSSLDASHEVTTADALPPRLGTSSDTPTALHKRLDAPDEAAHQELPNWNALQDEIESARNLASSTTATIANPEDAFSDAETLHRAPVPVELPPTSPVGPPTPPGGWHVLPATQRRAPPQFDIGADLKSVAVRLAGVQRIFLSMRGQDGAGIVRTLRSHPEALLVVIVAFAIFSSLLLLLLLAATRPGEPVVHDAAPAGTAASQKR